MKFLSDSLAYIHPEHALEVARQQKKTNSASERLFVHTYWSGNITAKVALSLKSLLLTQNLQNTTCTLWLDEVGLDEKFAENPFLKPLLPLLDVQIYRASEQAKNTLFEQSRNLVETVKPAARSDLFRLLILLKYGGVYSDIDVIYLRDLSFLKSVFPGQTLVFQWSAMPYATNAFCLSETNSPSLIDMSVRAVREGSCHPRLLLSYKNPVRDLLVLPVTWFSPIWLIVDKIAPQSDGFPFSTFADFFRASPKGENRPEFDSFFQGAFTYHWHNLYAAPELKNSYAGYLNAEIDRRFSAKFGIKPEPSFLM